MTNQDNDLRGDLIVVTDEHGRPVHFRHAVTPDAEVAVEHAHCGDLHCQRPDGMVRAAVVWLDPDVHGAPFSAVIDDEGLPLCEQTLARLAEQITALDEQREK